MATMTRPEQVAALPIMFRDKPAAMQAVDNARKLADGWGDRSNLLYEVWENSDRANRVAEQLADAAAEVENALSEYAHLLEKLHDR